MFYSKSNRRHFLQGIGGFTLGLPFLPSLVIKSARAEDPLPPKRFIALWSGLGGVLDSNWYPTANPSGPESLIYSASQTSDGSVHNYRKGPLQIVDGRISNVFGPEISAFKDQMNIVRGLDFMFHAVHHKGNLGNFATSNQNKTIGMPQIPSIDQVIGKVRDAGLLHRNIVVQSRAPLYDGSISYSYEGTPQNPTDIRQVSALSAKDLFDKIFKVAPPSGTFNRRQFIADKIRDDVQNLLSGISGDARRLSAEDRTRVQQHIDLLDETERKTRLVSSCGENSPPGNNTPYPQGENNPELAVANFKLFNDVIAIAFKCDSSRLATFQIRGEGIYEHGISHSSHEPSHQATVVQYNDWILKNIIADLLTKLNVEEANGKTYLDNSLIMYTQESCMNSHECISMPCVTWGSAGGEFATGNYIDYRNLNSNLFKPIRDYFYPGVPWNRWLATILQTQGLTPAQYERPGIKGYGEQFIERGESTLSPTDRRPAYQHQLADIGKILPGIK